jgi:hypothetical protein
VSTAEAAPPRADRRRRRRGREVSAAEPRPVPLSKVTVIDAEPFPDRETAEAWLAWLGGDPEALAEKTMAALAEVNHMLRAQRAAAGDPYVHEVSEDEALVRRVGYGRGAALSDGRYDAAIEPPPSPPRRRRTRPARRSAHDRVAAVLAGRASVLVCEELVLRARLDLAADRLREAALQARIALEAMLSELGAEPGLSPALDRIRERRDAVAEAANAALEGELDEHSREAVQAAVEGMEAALARRLEG